MSCIRCVLSLVRLGVLFRMKLHFVDSGAHTWLNKMLKHGRGKMDYSQYKTKEFWEYVDSYAEFIKEHANIIDHYANVDAIRNPKMSWKIQQYLENEHGLKPIPVIHYGTHVRWISRYLDRGHKYIALGGPIRRQGHVYHHWADKACNVICGGADHLPMCKVHGFSVTTHRHICRYPWYSVDSVTWKKMAYYGQILVPSFRLGKPAFDIPNMVVFIDPNTKYIIREGKGRHFLHLPRTARQNIRRWLDSVGISWGKSGKDGSIIIPGVTNDEIVRRAATIQYYLHLVKSLPRWPWPFHAHERNSLKDLL